MMFGVTSTSIILLVTCEKEADSALINEEVPIWLMLVDMLLQLVPKPKLIDYIGRFQKLFLKLTLTQKTTKKTQLVEISCSSSYEIPFYDLYHLT